MPGWTNCGTLTLQSSKSPKQKYVTQPWWDLQSFKCPVSERQRSNSLEKMHIIWLRQHNTLWKQKCGDNERHSGSWELNETQNELEGWGHFRKVTLRLDPNTCQNTWVNSTVSHPDLQYGFGLITATEEPFWCGILILLCDKAEWMRALGTLHQILV